MIIANDNSYHLMSVQRCWILLYAFILTSHNIIADMKKRAPSAQVVEDKISIKKIIWCSLECGMEFLLIYLHGCTSGVFVIL